MAPRQRFCQSSPDEADSPEQQQQPLVAKPPMPTLNYTETDVARDRHDYFNLVSLLFIIGSTALNYDWEKFASMQGMRLSWTGSFFWESWTITLIYFLMDLTWVARVPICVKSPGVIVGHHIVAMAYLAAPVYYPEYRWFMGSILSVEVNTWFLILRRVVFKQPDVHPILTETISALFYITWVLIRLIIYPGVLLTFLSMAHEHILETGIFWHLPMIFIPVHFFLCMLNLKWTYDLFTPIVKRWLGIGPKPMVVQNGL